MAEELKIIWLDGSNPNASAPRGGTSPGGGSPSAQTAGRATTGDSAKGPKSDSTVSSIGSLLSEVADYVGFGRLYKSITEVIGGFDELNKSLDDFFGKREEAKASSGPAENAGSSSIESPFGENPATGPSSPSSIADDFIEGEFTPKESASKALSTIGRTLGPEVMEGEVVGGGLSTELAAAGPAIEGELASGAAAAGTSLAGVAAVALPLTVALAAVAGAVYAFKMGLTQAYKDIENLEGFSSELSSVNANNEVRMMMAEINRAERLGPQLAELSDVTSRGQEALYEIGTELMSAFLDYLEKMKPFIDAGIVAAQLIPLAINNVKEALDVLVAFASANPVQAIFEAKDYFRAIKDNTKKAAEILAQQQQDIPINDPFIDDFLKGAFDLFGKHKAPPPAPRAPGPLPGGMI